VPQPLRQVLPDVIHPPADWRDFAPETLTVAPYRGFTTPFHVVRVTRDGDVTTWVGRNGLPGASLVAIGKRDRWDATLTMIGGSFDIHVHGSNVQVVEHTTPLVCGGVRPAPTAAEVDRKSLIHPGEVRPAPAAVPITGDPSIHTSGTTIYTVEVAYFYTKDLEDTVTAAAGGLANVPAYLDSTFRAWNETHNLIIEQSKIPNMRWHYAGLYRVPDYTLLLYDHKGPGGAARYNMAYDIDMIDGSEAQVNPANAQAVTVSRFVATTETAHAADISVLMLGANRDVSGLANFDGHHCAVLLSGGMLDVAHEIGHTFGLYHDRETDSIPDGNGWYNCGHLFHYDPARFGGQPYDAKIGDIMSYGVMTPFFSNPHVAAQGSDFAAGSIVQPDPNWYPIGVEVDQPRAAHAARWLWEHAQAKATRVTEVALTFPAVTIQPIATLGVGLGGDLRLSVTATGTNLQYQWRKNGAAISGATSATYTKDNASAGDAGNYDVMVTNALGTVITRAAVVSVSNEPVSARLVNISTRSQVGVGNDVQIAGFVITGNTPKTVLVRAGSALLAGYGLGSLLADPLLELHDLHTTLTTNDNWSSDATKAAAIRSAASQVGAAAWADGTRDAAILTTLNPGIYSAVVKGKNDTSGMAIVEVYEVTATGGHVVNISTRSQVGVGNDVQIAGFVITGNTPKTVLVRAGSAVLAGYGLGSLLADPLLELHDLQTTITTNDNWSSDAANAAAIRSAATQVGAAAWAEGTRDAAILITLNPGIYSAVVKSKDDTSGMAIAEVYEVTP
jgi:hypothetical protein